MKWYSYRELAALKGCAKATVTRAIQRGDLASRGGKVSEAAAAEWTPKKRRTPRRDYDPTAPEPGAPSQTKDAAQTDEGPTLNPYQAATQRLKIIEAERADRKWKQEQGLLVEREQVVNLLVDFASRLRSEMQSYPRRMQTELVRTLRCKRCGGDVDGRSVAITAERFVDDFLRVLADSPIQDLKAS